jgi:uncharacterized protein with von Willebrand factor type A (vWA) domain
MPDPGAAPHDPEVDGRALVAEAVGFGRALRRAGLDGDVATAARFADALTRIDLAVRGDVRAAGAAVFVRRREQLPVYEDVFDAWWGRRLADQPASAGPRLGAHSPRHESLAAGSADEPDDEPQSLSLHGRYSALEVLREREFEAMSAAELRDAQRLIDLLAPRVARRRSRRYRIDRRGRRLAPRQMFRRNVPAGGDLVAWAWRRPVDKPRRLVVLADVSGSMERHARLLLRFVCALSAASATRAESFVFGTRLTRVTRLLRGTDPDLALARVAEQVRDWGGGTRIGEALRDFNLHWARRTLRSSGLVVIVSDGWDRGDPELVRRETARLRRNCHRLIWVNPVAGVPGYQPLAAGMAAAHPFIDHLVPARNLASLEYLGELLAGSLG